MNKELEKSKKAIDKRTKRLQNELDIELSDKTDEPRIAYLMQEIEVNKTVLNYIENSIPKEVVEEKIKELANTKGDFATYIAVSERIKALQELMEGK